MLDIRLLPRGAGKTLGCRNYLRDNFTAKFLIGDKHTSLQQSFLCHIHSSQPTTSIRGHPVGTTFVLDELICYSHERQDYILTYSDRYNFIIYTSSESFSSDISPDMHRYIYTHNPEYLL